VGLEAWNFEGQRAWIWESSEDTGATLGEKAGQTAERPTAWEQ